MTTSANTGSLIFSLVHGVVLQGVPKKRTFRIIILQADTSERSPEAAWSLQARLVGLDGLKDRNDDSESAFFLGHCV